jgi:hypothetical protein
MKLKGKWEELDNEDFYNLLSSPNRHDFKASGMRRKGDVKYMDAMRNSHKL